MLSLRGNWPILGILVELQMQRDLFAQLLLLSLKNIKYSLRTDLPMTPVP